MMTMPAQVTRFLVTAPPLTLLWTVACPLILRHSSGVVMAFAFGAGWVSAFWLGCVAAGWIPAPPARPVHHHCPHGPSRAFQEHQQHLHDQAREAYLVNPDSQLPPPTDNYPGF